MALSGLHTDWGNSAYLALGIFLLLLVAGNIHGASFDCSKATSEAEKLICGDEELSRLDESLNKSYLEALKRTLFKKQMGGKPEAVAEE